jgi:hypothetical protein
MIRASTPLRLTRLRASIMALLGLLVGTSCSETTDPLGTSAPTDLPAPVASTDSAAASDTLAMASTFASYDGVPFGPFGLWSSWSSTYWGPKPLTNAQQCVNPSGIVTLIQSARLKGQSLVLQMTCGAKSDFMTNGNFDVTKWKSRMSKYNTSSIRNAIAAGVSDGTLIANSMVDEPEHKHWGTSITKGLLDNMAAYAKSMFPTLPQGVSHGPNGYTWRASERFTKLDYVNYQFAYRIANGNVTAFRDAVLDQSRKDGVATSFSVNVLNGGRQDLSGSWDCTGSGQAGKGTYSPNCRMTATQLRDWGKTLGTSGACMLLMWKYNGTYFSRSDNQDALQDVASTLASKSRKSCRRP